MRLSYIKIQKISIYIGGGGGGGDGGSEFQSETDTLKRIFIHKLIDAN